MAVTFNDTFDFIVGDTSQYLGSGNYVTNGEGTSVTALSVFDYFSDTPSVGNTFEFGSNRIFKDVIFYVGTAMDGTPAFIWEYKTGSTTWTTLNVCNGDALTKTGQQTVTFTPPNNWDGGALNDRPLYRIRVRLTDVTGVTEGGAQSTQKFKAGNMAFRITGTNQTISNVVADNDANYYQILIPTTPADSLTPIEMPTLRLGLSDLVDIIISDSTDIGAGDTVVLTGTDMNGTAQIETIDVSGGNATYTSTKFFQNITNIACNGFTDGTIEVRTKKRGMIRQAGASYDIAAHLFIGDGSTTTTFTVSSQSWHFRKGYDFVNEVASTLTFGTESLGGKVDGTTNWSFVYFTESDRGFAMLRKLNLGTLNLYGTTLFGSNRERPGMWITSGTINMRDSKIYLSNISPDGTWTINNSEIENIYTSYGNFGSNSSINGLTINSLFDLYNNRTTPLNLNNCFIEGMTRVNNVQRYRVINLINCNLTTADITNTASNGEAGDGVYIKFSFDLKVIDNSGSPIDGATVTIKNLLGATVATLTTDASGNITQQSLNNAKGSWPCPGSGLDWTSHTPHTVTISKDGYQTKTIKYTMDRKREEIEVLEPAVKILMPMGEKIYKNLKPADGQNKILWTEI